MRRTAHIIAVLLLMLGVHLKAAGQAAVVIDPSQIAASATNAAEQVDYMLVQLGELAELGNELSSVRNSIQEVFGENGVGGKTISVLQDLGTLTRMIDTYNATIEQIRQQSEMIKKMQGNVFMNTNMMLTSLNSVKQQVELCVEAVKHIISTVGLSKKEKADEIDKLREELQEKIDRMNKMMQMELYSAQVAQGLTEFTKIIDNTMDRDKYVMTKASFGTLEDAGKGTVGIITILLGFLGILCSAYGFFVYVQGGIAGDPTVNNIFIRIGLGMVMGMLTLNLLAKAFNLVI